MKSRMVIHNAVKVDRDIKVFRCWRNACKNSKMFWKQPSIIIRAIHTSIPKKPFDHFWFISPVFYKLMSATLQKQTKNFTCFPLNFVNSCKFSQNTWKESSKHVLENSCLGNFKRRRLQDDPKNPIWISKAVIITTQKLKYFPPNIQLI